MPLIDPFEILETLQMIESERLDIRTITMGISLRDCADSDVRRACARIYDKICARAERLVATA
ncbi:MAG: DUF711 family protein, partial [bacterium]